MLVTMKEMLIKARKEGYGVIAPSIDSELCMKAAVEAAEELRSPVILNISYSVYPDPEVMKFYIDIAQRHARQASVPVAINQDHGRTFENAMQCIHSGYSSIMIDRSKLPYEENIKQVKELTDIAHACGVSVESELGHVGSGNENLITDESFFQESVMTDPKMAADFVERTGIDFLAVSIGNAHGVYLHGEPKLDFDRLKEIADAVSIPLVLHGGSGTGDENLAKACTMGIAKINVGTELRIGATKAITDIPFDEARLNPFNIMKAGYKERIKYHMNLFGSVGKADN